MRKTSERAPRRLGWLVAGLSAVTLLAGVGFARETFRTRQVDREIQALRLEAERLRIHNFQVSSLQASLDSGEFLEREARMKLGLQKVGEQVVVLRKEDRVAAAPLEEGLASRSLDESWSNAKKWWNYFADPHALADYARARSAAGTSGAAHPSR
ncbi:MAG: septum formation initiator family protein [Patescibacteria group bacterium]|nr:MAG: septum formation initiator family protein [Patescibacteria group bacterium]